MKTHPAHNSSHSYQQINVAAVVILAAGLAFSYLLPVLKQAGINPPSTCVSITLFGIPCPLCGLTRAFGFLMRGDVSQAVSLNILSVPAFCLAVIELLFRTIALTPGAGFARSERLFRVDMRIHLVILVCYIGYSLALAISQLASALF